MFEIERLRKFDFTCQLSPEVQISLKMDKLLVNMCQAIFVRVVSSILQKNFQNFAFEIFLQIARLGIIQLFDNLNTQFWMIEFTYAFSGIFGLIQSETSCGQNIDPFLLLYLFGICILILDFGKNHQIIQLEKQIKVGSEIVKRLVQDDNKPTMILKLNQQVIQKLNFEKVSQRIGLFAAFDRNLPHKYAISPQSVLYNVTCYNQSAAKFIGQTKPDLQDFQNKFKNILVPRNQDKILQEKNLHKILNQSGAILYQDLLTLSKSKSESQNIFRSFDLNSEVSREPISKIDDEFLSSSSMENSDFQVEDFKKLSELSMILFEQEFKTEKNLTQIIKCTIVYDTFILMLQNIPTSSYDNMELLSEEEDRLTQSEYLMVPGGDLIAGSVSPKENSQAVWSKHVIKKDKVPWFERSAQDHDLKRFLSGSMQQEEEKKSCMLDIQDGSLMSQEMLQESQSTVRIKIQSEKTSRSFYSEINLSRGLGNKNKSGNNSMMNTDLKNQQKEMALEFYKKRVVELEIDLSNTKIFLNMVIQDMRNPINKVNIAINKGLITISNAQSLLKIYEDDLLNDLMIIEQSQGGQCSCKNQPNQGGHFPSSESESIMIAPEDSNCNSINYVPYVDPKSNNSVMIPPKKKLLDIRRSSSQQNFDRIMELGENQQNRKPVHYGASQPLIPQRQIADDFQLSIIESQSEQIKEQIKKVSRDITNQKKLFEMRFQQSQQMSEQEQLSSQQLSLPSIGNNQSIQSRSRPLPIEEEEKVPNNPPRSKFFKIHEERSLEDDNSESLNFELKVSKQMQDIDQPSGRIRRRMQAQNSSSNVSSIDSYNGRIDKIKCPSFKLGSQSPSKKPDDIFVIEAFIENMIEDDMSSKISEINISLEVEDDREIKRLIEGQPLLIAERIKTRIKLRRRELNNISRLLKKSQSLMEGCEYSSNLTANLINDLLDFAKTEKFCFKIKKQYFNLVETIQNSFSVLKFEIDRKKIDLKFTYDQNRIYNQIYSDEFRYLQIFLNLLSNSLKYTPDKGKIQFKLESLEKVKMSNTFALDMDTNNESEQKWPINIERYINKMQIYCKQNEISVKDIVLKYKPEYINDYNYLNFQITIIDGGPQMTEEHLKSMFMDFHQLSDRQKLSPREAGLGLSICKNLIEKMGGSLKVTHKSGFTVQMTEILRVGKDKRDNFTVEEEFLFENLISESKKIEEKVIKLNQSNMGLIKERGSSSEGDNSNSSFVSDNRQAQDYSETYKNIGGDIADAVIQMKENENFSQQNDLNPFGSSSMESGKFMNFLGKIASLDSCDLAQSHGSRSSNSRVLLQEFKNRSKKDSFIDDEDQRSPVRQSPIIKRQVDHQLSNYGKNKSPKIVKRLSSIQPGSLEDMSISNSKESLQSDDHNMQSQNIKLEMKNPPRSRQYDEFHQMSILIANQDYQKILEIEQILNQFSIYDIYKADNGLVAYEKALSHKFDLILLDLNMPIMGGIEAGKKIFEHYTRRLIMIKDDERRSFSYGNSSVGNSSGSSVRMPLIYGITNHLTSAVIEKAKKAGFTDCVQTPLNHDKMTNILMVYVDELLIEQRQEIVIEEDLDQYELLQSHQSVKPPFMSPATLCEARFQSKENKKEKNGIRFQSSKSESLSDMQEQKIPDDEVDNSNTFFGRSFKINKVAKQNNIKHDSGKKYLEIKKEVIDEIPEDEDQDQSINS